VEHGRAARDERREAQEGERVLEEVFVIDKRRSREELSGKVIDVHAHVGQSLSLYATESFPHSQSLEDLCYRLDANDVDLAVVFPFGSTLYFDPYALRRGHSRPAKHPISPTPFEIENRMVYKEAYEFCPQYRGRVLPGLCIDPRRDVPGQLRAAREIEKQYPVYLLKIIPIMLQVGVKNLLSYGKAFLDFAAERNIPFLIHATIAAGDRWSQVSDILDIAERRQDLRFCMAHLAGADRVHLKHASELPNVWIDTSALKIQVQIVHEDLPLMARGKRRFPADYSDHKKVLRALLEAYPDRIMWGTDSPAYSYMADRRDSTGQFVRFRLRGTYEDEKAALDALPPALRRKAANENTLDFLFGRGPA